MSDQGGGSRGRRLRQDVCIIVVPGLELRGLLKACEESAND